MDFYILNIGAFLIAITILTLTPGLDTALVIRNTSRSGWANGWVTSLGICCGLFGHATLSAIGISAILLQSAQLFSIIKLIGAGYLIYLGANSLWSLRKPSEGLNVSGDLVNSPLGQDPSSRQNRSSKKDSSSKRDSLWRAFREGVLSNILNPKTAVFYLAFLPQFINPEHSAIVQSLLMAAIHFVIAMIWQCGLASMVNVAKNFVRNSSVMRWMEASTGMVLVVLGVKLALDK